MRCFFYGLLACLFDILNNLYRLFYFSSCGVHMCHIQLTMFKICEHILIYLFMFIFLSNLKHEACKYDIGTWYVLCFKSLSTLFWLTFFLLYYIMKHYQVYIKESWLLTSLKKRKRLLDSNSTVRLHTFFTYFSHLNNFNLI